MPEPKAARRRQGFIVAFSGIFVVLSVMAIIAIASRPGPGLEFSGAASQTPGSADANGTWTSVLEVTFTPLEVATATTVPLNPIVPLTPTQDSEVEALITGMSVRQLIGQMIMIGLEGQEVTPAICQVVRQIQPGGVVFRDGNVSSPKQLLTFVTELDRCSRSAPPIPLLFAIDHEGEYVTRFESGVTVFPAAMAQAATGEPAYAYRIALAAGRDLASAGINTVLGPVADVLVSYDNEVISLRSFGGEPSLVSSFVRESIRGYLEAGVIPVVKHFPGHGGTAADPHFSLPVDLIDDTALLTIYMPPFRAAIEAGSPAVMVGHVVFPALDPRGVPSTLSEATMNLLRRGLGFQGMVMTDSMGLAAITRNGYSIPEASVQAILAGVDMVLITSSDQAVSTLARILSGADSGEIANDRIIDAVRHVLSLKVAAGLTRSPGPQAAWQDLQAQSELAAEAGYRAVALLRDDAELIPIPPDLRHVLIVGPTDGWGLYRTLNTALREEGFLPQVVIYSEPWKGPIPETWYVETVPKQAAAVDLTIMLTWDAHLNRLRFGDTLQSDLVSRLLETGTPTIVAALKSPTDILDFPMAPTYLMTFGTTRGQLRALADALVGRWQPIGVVPLPGLQ